MGSGITKFVTNDHDGSVERYQHIPPRVSTKLKLESDTPLMSILQRSIMQQKLRVYVQTKWVPSAPDDAYFTKQGKSIALNFLDFLLESRDFAEIPRCNFQHFRACSIFEKYIMHGATNQVPLSKVVVDECTHQLYGRAVDELEVRLFDAAMAEASDFLLAEVFPSFQKVSIAALTDKQSADIAGAMRVKVMEVIHPPRKNDRRIASKILSDSGYRRALRLYFRRVDSELRPATLQAATARGGHMRLIDAYERILQIESDVAGLEKEDLEISMVLFWSWVHAFYADFLLAGHPYSLGLTAATKGDFLLKIAKCCSPTHEVLMPVENNVKDIIQQQHLEGFLASPEHAAIIRSGRRTVHLMASSLPSHGPNHTFPGDEIAAVTDDDGDDDCDDDEEDDDDEDDATGGDWLGRSCREEGAETGGAEEGKGTDLELSVAEEVRRFLRSQYDVVFGQYLDMVAQECVYMYFYQSVYRYKKDLSGDRAEDSGDIGMERIAHCTLIFERFLSVNSSSPVSLPPAITTAIVKNMFRPDEFVFDDAAKWVLDHFCCNRWPLFKKEIMQRASGTSGASGRLTPADDSSDGNNSKPVINYTASSSSLSSSFHGSSAYESFCRSLVHVVSKPREEVLPTSALVKGHDVPVAPTSPTALRKGSGGQSIVGGEVESTPSSEDVVLTAQDSICVGRDHVAADNDMMREMSPGSQESGRKGSTGVAPGLRGDGKVYVPAVRFEDVMLDSQCCSLFKRFLDAEHTSQTLLFLTEIEEYRIIPDFDFRQARARKIFHKFLHDKALTPVPVTCTTRRDVQSLVGSREAPLHAFNPAVVEVRRYVEYNQFPRFLLADGSAAQLLAILHSPHRTPSQEAALSVHHTLTSEAPDAVRFHGSVRNLRDVLHCPKALRFFREYCLRVHCNENLFFWLDADNYSNMPGSDFRKRTAIKLCKKYIDENSKMQVNISSAVRKRVVHDLACPDRHIFRKAQEEVFRLMETDTFPRYLDSPEFQKMIIFFGSDGRSYRAGPCVQSVVPNGSTAVHHNAKEVANIWLDKCQYRSS